MQWNLAQSISSASKQLRVTEAMESSSRYIQWNLVQGISQPPAQIPSPSNESHIYHEIVSSSNDCDGSEEIRTSRNPRGTGFKNQQQTGPKQGFNS